MQRRAFLLTSLLPAWAQSGPEKRPIFDGQTLTGWSVQNGPDTAFFVEQGEIVLHPGSSYPTWLRYDRKLENFDFEADVLIRGWANSGIYFSAPEHGPALHCGFKINLFQNNEGGPKPTSMGAVFPVVPPSRIAVKPGGWNPLRIRFDYPRLSVWVNGEMVQDLAVDMIPELAQRLRHGYLGIETQGHPLRFRNLRLAELPSTDPAERWYATPADFDKWTIVADRNANAAATWERIGNVLRADGLGYLATKEKFRNFYLEMYVRQSLRSNGGVYFRVAGDDSSAPHYEIQLYDVESANYATGSLYGLERSRYPRVQPEEWYLFQMWARDKQCTVRINGETVTDTGKLDRNEEGRILLQAHQRDRWIEYKEIRITRL